MSSLGRTDFPGVKQDGTDTDQQKANVANQTVLGKLNNSAEWTLAANATTTTFEDDRIYETSYFVLDPRTPNARAALFSMYVSAVARGEVTVTHTSTAATDKTFIAGIFS